MTNSTIIKSGLLMFAFTLICVFIVSLVEQTTEDKIEFNEQQLLISRLHEITSDYDNSILADKYFRDVELHGIKQTVTIFPAKKNGQVVAHLVEHTYPNGYNGDIRLLTGVDRKGQLIGVRVINHRETPGLGDKIEARKSDWIKGFNGLSLDNPIKSKWKVKRDGGYFDQFTGATITPRAVVSAAYQVLEYFNNNEVR